MLGRVVRTTFIMRYLQDAKMRDRVQLQPLEELWTMSNKEYCPRPPPCAEANTKWTLPNIPGPNTSRSGYAFLPRYTHNKVAFAVLVKVMKCNIRVAQFRLQVIGS